MCSDSCPCVLSDSPTWPRRRQAEPSILDAARITDSSPSGSRTASASTCINTPGWEDQIVSDMTRLPFGASSFDSVTLIAALNHIPRPLRDPQLAEMQRVLRPGGRIIITMGTAFAESAVHRLVHFYSERFKTHEDMDHERGMEEDEDYSITKSEILERLRRTGFVGVRQRRIWTQFGLNKLYIAVK